MIEFRVTRTRIETTIVEMGDLEDEDAVLVAFGSSDGWPGPLDWELEEELFEVEAI